MNLWQRYVCLCSSQCLLGPWNTHMHVPRLAKLHQNVHLAQHRTQGSTQHVHAYRTTGIQHNSVLFELH